MTTTDDLDPIIAQALAWHPPDLVAGGIALRPLSLCSQHTLQLLGSELPEEREARSADEERRDVALYLWLHSAPVAEISIAIWSGSWRAVVDAAVEDLTDDAVEDCRAMFWRQRQLLAAAEVRLIPKPDLGQVKLPPEVVAAPLLAHRLGTLASRLRLSLDEIGWELPIPQAWQLYHEAMLAQGSWTARPAVEIAESEFVDFDPLGANEPAQPRKAGEKTTPERLTDK